MQFSLTIRNVVRLAGLVLSLCCLGSFARAQSTDISAPAAVRTNEVLGSIAARDIGDSRLTDHFFAFTGTPGDLLITIDSRNINGDVDVFTTTGLRPLLKLTVYAGNSSPVTKSIYLRKRESLILRIEGRTPNDEEGTYRLYFGGSFEPIETESQLPEKLSESEGSTTEPGAPGGKSGKKGRRVSSVGARIEEPPPAEVAVVPTPEPSPAEATPEVVKVEPSKPEDTRTEVTKAEVPKAPARTIRGRRPTGRRAPAAAPPKVETAKSEAESAPTTENTEAEAKPVPTRKRPARKPTAARTAEPAAMPAEAESGPRLVIETNDGTMINRYMSSVRRVVIERGQVVVTGNDGKIEKVPLASVVRMSISP